ncbi:MAG: TIGR00730 family Rossman fold protein [Pseudomonadota bacterium]
MPACRPAARVVGVIPEFLRAREVGHGAVTELVVVDSMHQRKQTMFERSDGFVILPGGLGTLDEAFEVLTWKQLRLHDKPIVAVDIAGYWQPLQALIDHVIGQGFARPAMRDLMRVVDDVDQILPALEDAAPAAGQRRSQAAVGPATPGTRLARGPASDTVPAFPSLALLRSPHAEDQGRQAHRRARWR